MDIQFGPSPTSVSDQPQPSQATGPLLQDRIRAWFLGHSATCQTFVLFLQGMGNKVRTRFEKVWGNCAPLLREMFADVKSILRLCHLVWEHKTAVWLQLGVLSLALAPLILSSTLPWISSRRKIQYCDPGGNFNVDGSYHLWKKKHLFQITLGFGTLTFSSVKAIDIGWDLVVGRGGQGLLIFVSYKVFTKVLTHMVEETQASVPYGTFSAVVFKEPSLSSVSTLSQNLLKLTSTRSKMKVLWIMLASIYLMWFPTIVSAMTGYAGNTSPYLNTTEGQIPWAANRVTYIIHDGDRINLEKEYVVGADGYGSFYGSLGDQDYTDCAGSCPDINDWDLAHYPLLHLCKTACDISTYVGAYYQGNTKRHMNSSFGGRHLSTTILNITSFNTSTSLLAKSWVPIVVPLNMTQDPMPITYALQKNTYSETYVNTHASCMPLSTYKWGFSFLQLFIFFIISTVWAVGMYSMWMDCYLNSRLDRAHKSMGLERGIVDFSMAMRENIDEYQIQEAPNAVLKALIQNNRNGGPIAFGSADRTKLPATRRVAFHELRKATSISALSGWTLPWQRRHWAWCTLFWILLALLGLSAREIWAEKNRIWMN